MADANERRRVNPKTVLAEIGRTLDFRAFDFDPLPLDATGRAFVKTMRRLFDWPPRRQGDDDDGGGGGPVVIRMPGRIRFGVRSLLEGRRLALREETRRLVASHEEARAALSARIEAAEAETREAAALPEVEKQPGRFSLAVKAVDEDTHLGLPGATVRLVAGGAAGRSARAALAESVTDSDGNAVLTLDEAALAAFGEESEPVVEVLGPDGKSVLQAKGEIGSPRAGATETFVAKVKSTARTKPLVAAASEVVARRRAALESLTNALRELDADRDVVETELREREKLTGDLLTELKKELTRADPPPVPRAGRRRSTRGPDSPE